MRCVSLWQPWASLLAHGLKRVETRGWPTAHRGPLLVHAAKRWDADLALVAANQWFRPALAAAGVRFSADVGEAKAGWNLPFGAVVGRVEVYDCVPTERAVADWSRHGSWAADRYAEEVRFGDYAPGRWAWLCRDAVPFPEPVPLRGRQGIWDVREPHVIEAIERMVCRE